MERVETSWIIVSWSTIHGREEYWSGHKACAPRHKERLQHSCYKVDFAAYAHQMLE